MSFSSISKIPWIASMQIAQLALKENIIDIHTYFKLEKLIEERFGDR